MAASGPFIVYVQITKALSSKFMIKSEIVLLSESFFGGKIFLWINVLCQRDTFDYGLPFSDYMNPKGGLGFVFSLNSETERA